MYYMYTNVRGSSSGLGGRVSGRRDSGGAAHTATPRRRCHRLHLKGRGGSDFGAHLGLGALEEQVDDRWPLEFALCAGVRLMRIAHPRHAQLVELNHH